MIGLVKEGDIIEIDIPGRTIELKVSDKELAKRKAAWRKPKPRFTTGWLARYAEFATSADTGAVLSIKQ